MVKVLLDTDIGTDIDDAVCLAYLLAQPECDLLGITTVAREPETRAALADAICKAAGRSIPIFPGRAMPLLIDHPPGIDPSEGEVKQGDALSRWSHYNSFLSGQYLDFMRSTIRQYPDEVILLAIGQLTNVALLFATDPEAAARLKGLVWMGGFFSSLGPANGGYTEWNAIWDPHAAGIVYRTDLMSHRSVGLDVTLKVTMPEPEVRRRFGTHSLLRTVLDFSESWFRVRPYITFHDPLAAATIFDDHICEFRRGDVSVELISSRTAGMTYWRPDAEHGKHEVAETVNSERFFDNFFSLFR